LSIKLYSYSNIVNIEILVLIDILLFSTLNTEFVAHAFWSHVCFSYQKIQHFCILFLLFFSLVYLLQTSTHLIQ